MSDAEHDASGDEHITVGDCGDDHSTSGQEYKMTGGCLCGGVKYEFTKPLSMVHRCHCTICRKCVGADFLTFGVAPNTHFKMLKEDTLREYCSSEGSHRCFCSNCGASLFCKIDGMPNHIILFMGTVDGDPKIMIESHIYVSSKAPWVTIDDGLPQIERGLTAKDFEKLK